MSIRNLIENHQGLVVRADIDGNVIVPQADFLELIELAHEGVHPESVQVQNDHSPRLASQLWAEAWLAGPEEPEPEDKPDESPEYDRGYDQARDDHHREFAVAYATQVVTTSIQASHGLESTDPKVEDIAKGIYDFLTGK